MIEQPLRSIGFLPGSVGDSNAAFTEQTLWQHIQEARTLQELADSWIQMQCRMINGILAGLVALGNPGSGPFTPVAQFPSQSMDMRYFQKIVERVLKERKGVVIKKESPQSVQVSDSSQFLCAYPLIILGQLYGAVAVEVTGRSQSQLQVVMRQLQWGMAWLENRVLNQRALEGTTNSSTLATALDLTAVALQEERYRAAATAFATEVATRLNCDRVSIGFLRHKKNQVDVLSHSALFGKQMNLMRAIGEAMDECTDQLMTLAYPEPNEKSVTILYAHKQLAKQQGDGAICTVPLRGKSGKALGAMMLERSNDLPFDAKSLNLIENIASLVGPILHEKRLNDRFLLTKIVHSLRVPLEMVFGAGHLVFKLAAFTLTALILFLCFATGDYRVTAHSLIEGEIQRALVAPYNSFIHEAKARAGDVLKAGDEVCSLDDRDLRLERLAWLSQKEQYQRQLREAMAVDDRPRTKVLNEQINQADTQIALLDEQISRAKIVAPFDGFVVSGDLTQSLGAPVERGQVLFEMAPLDTYRVILEVEEADVNDLLVGQSGQILLTALPHMPLPIQVEKITPVSISKEGKTYFEVEAKLEQLSPELRPGMEGIGKVSIEERRLIWIWTHDMINWFRLWIWSRWP